MKELYCSRAPLRLGLAGGGTDVSPFSDLHGGFVLNATIDLYAHSILEPLDGDRIIFAAEDREEYLEFDNSSFLVDQEPLRLHRGIYNRIIRQFPQPKPLSFKLTTFADAPAGSGLGTSSTMVVSIIQVFSEWLGLGLGEYEIAQLAYEIERVDLGFAGGKQDQYAAAFGGFNLMEFGPSDKVLVNPLRIKESVRKELEISTVLYFSGKSRDSSRIIEDQIKESKLKNSTSLDAMFALKQDAMDMKDAILRGNLDRYAMLMKRSWDSKKKLAANVSNPFLDAIYDGAINAGALAGKISGAGGGGFFMFFVPPEKRMSVIKYLMQNSGQVMNFHFTQDGSHSWTIKK